MSSTEVTNEVYNGTKKINEPNKNFMTRSNVRNAILSLKLKNSEGFDRIPQRIYVLHQLHRGLKPKTCLSL